MIRTYATQMIREREYEVVHAAPQDSLMKKAAGAVADGVAASLSDAGIDIEGARVVALVGGGDNGGDALYASAFLQRIGVDCTCVLLTDNVHPRGRARAEKEGVRIVEPDLSGAMEQVGITTAEAVVDADVVIDGMLGTGGQGALREPMATVVAMLQVLFKKKHHPIVVAIDLPSGLGSDDGVVAGEHLQADKTVTMGARKPASLIPPACRSFGSWIDVVGLGLELDSPVACALEADDVARVIHVPGFSDHKYTRGVVQVVAGSSAYPMTGVMCVEAAARSGAGMVRFRGPEDALLAVLSRIPETVLTSGRYQAQLIGPGIDESDKRRVSEAIELAKQCVSSGLPLILDAGAITLFTRIFTSKRVPVSAGAVVLTPHAGEAAQLLSELGEGEGRGGVSRAEVEERPLEWAIRLAELTKATIVLKGAQTLIVSLQEARTFDCDMGKTQVFVQNEAPGWAGTAGSGDVLAGIMVSMFAGVQARAEKRGRSMNRGDAAFVAAASVWIHGMAARIAAGLGQEAALTLAYDASRIRNVRTGGKGFADTEGKGRTSSVSRSNQSIQGGLSDGGFAQGTSVGHPIIASDIAAAIPSAIGVAIN